MRLNSLQPALGSKSKRVRVGRGIGSGLGKTCGRGHKGQSARSGYGRKSGFEGGQLPIYRRLPKLGFHSRTADRVAELRLDLLNRLTAVQIDLTELKRARLVSAKIQSVKIIGSGKLERAVTLSGIRTTAGARRSIEAAGGQVI